MLRAGKLYAIGGSGSSSASTVEAYDPAQDSWTSLPAMPTGRYGLGVVTALNGKIYAIGGYDRSGAPLNTVEELNLDTNIWQSRASMPTACGSLGLVAGSNGRVYAVGGQGAGTAFYLDVAEEYNPYNNTWTTLSRMPTSRYGLGLAQSGDSIYAVGGFFGVAQSLRTVEEAIIPMY